MRKNSTLNWRKVLSIGLAVVVLFGAVAGLTALFSKQTKTIGASAFAVGAIAADSGEHEPDETAIYTKEAFSCQGLRIQQKFEAKGTFQVFFYDASGELLDKTDELTGTYESDFPQADSCRVVYRPAVPEGVKASDFRIRFYEVYSYANELTITVNKEQEEYKTSTNLYVEGGVGKFTADDVSTVVDGPSFKVSEIITVDEEYDYYQIYVCTDAFSTEDVIVAFGNAENKAVKLDNRGKTVEGIAYTFEGESMKTDSWYTVIVEVPVDAEILRVCGPTGAEIRIYGVVED